MQAYVFLLVCIFSMIRLVILKCLCVPFPFDNLAILIVRVLYVSAFRSRSCWMMSGVRRNVKSCLRTERRVLPPLTHHNTHRLMKALQPGNCLILCYYAWQVILFSWVITGKDWKRVWNVCPYLCWMCLGTSWNASWFAYGPLWFI